MRNDRLKDFVETGSVLEWIYMGMQISLVLSKGFVYVVQEQFEE